VATAEAITSPANHQRPIVLNDAAVLLLNQLRAERVLVLATIPIRELPRSGIWPSQMQSLATCLDRLLTKVGVNIIDHGLAAAASVRL